MLIQFALGAEVKTFCVFLRKSLEQKARPAGKRPKYFSVNLTIQLKK